MASKKEVRYISDQVKKGKERAPHRSLFFATGMKRADMKKPFIGICNSYESFVPGHCHLNRVGEIVKKAVIEAGGVPMEFNTIAVCDGIAMAHAGMKFSLPSRELIADSVERDAHWRHPRQHSDHFRFGRAHGRRQEPGEGRRLRPQHRL